MKAELIAVGSELLGGGRRDTNAVWLTEKLERLGIAVAARALVGDEVERIAGTVRTALSRAELIIVTGGLGPTEDDLTREGLALALDRPLERDPEQVERLVRRFESFGRRFGPEQLRQAERPRGAEWIENPRGSAPGWLVRDAETLLCVLPGVPSEMQAMFEAGVAPKLAPVAGGGLARSTLKIAGRTEPAVDRLVSDLYGSGDPRITILTGVRGIELHLRVAAESAERARADLARLEAEIRSRLGEDLFGRDDETLAGVVGALLRARGATLATAESCTGGLLGGEITATPGSSSWYRGGLVVYSNELKQRLAGVTATTLATHGAVSEGVALELARGARDRCGADFGLGITGVAGPGGGTPDKPVGRVHLALADATDVRHWQIQLPGGREEVRGRAVTLALDRLRRRLIGGGASR